MKFLESNTIENFNITHHIEHFPYRNGEVILLLPYNKGLDILVGVNRIPFLNFMSIPYSVTSYEFFECDIEIDYNFTNNVVLITNRERIKERLIEFSEMVYDILKSAGTESKYISLSKQRDIDFAIRHKDDVNDEAQTLFENNHIILEKTCCGSNNYEISINNESIFRSKNSFAVNKIWNVLKSVLYTFKINIKNKF